MDDKPGLHIRRGWLIFLGVGAFLGVVFAVGDLPGKLSDACNNWNIEFCRDRYGIEDFIATDAADAPEADWGPTEALGVEPGATANSVTAIFPPGVEISNGPVDEGRTQRTWHWEGIRFSAEIELTTDSIGLPFTIAVESGSQWMVPVPDGIIVGSSSLIEAEEALTSAELDADTYFFWFEGYNHYGLRADESISDFTLTRELTSADGPRGDSQRPLDDEICSRTITAYSVGYQDFDSLFSPENAPSAGSCLSSG